MIERQHGKKIRCWDDDERRMTNSASRQSMSNWVLNRFTMWYGPMKAEG